MEKKKLATKKCPYCSVTLGMDVTQCHSCKAKVGKPDKYGIAKKPFDWMSHLLFVISFAGLIYFIWWYFLKAQ